MDREAQISLVGVDHHVQIIVILGGTVQVVCQVPRLDT
jgi:hypothetical protein